MKEITLIIADDHPLFRQGVVDALSLEKDFKIVAQASDGKEAIALIRSLNPTVAIVDINMPGMNGQQVTHQVTSEHLSTRVVLLTGYDDVEQAIHAVLAGAVGYCAKEIQPDVLARTVRAVAEGKYAIAGNIFNRRDLDRWIDEQMDGARRSYSEPGSPFHPLSDREMEVLACVVRGMSNKEIAGLLGISHQTVKNHVTSILRKFGVEDRTQAVVYALRRGWVKLQDSGIKSQE
ncbi:MAG TPA: response regulator transcription factor [Anaerolineales bacterium]|jgi:DNA-binding NarL/FixJ family response regulator|nr:response regulator transcription factor [Anaerolineales bacterium]